MQDDVVIGKEHRQYGSMLLGFLEAEARRLGQDALAKVTPENWPRVRDDTRARIFRDLGLDPLPPRTPLNARSGAQWVSDGVRVEQVVFEPRPGFEAPGLLYCPVELDAPAPAVLYAEGHWMRYGKAEPHIQAACMGLAQLGFVALVFDPIGQGERGPSFRDHGHRELIPVGLSQEGLMVWEHIRALDYLLTRAEVDGNRLGITGASGGGLSTIYTAAVDDRVQVAVPVCYVTAFSTLVEVLRGLNWNNQGDLCNQVPNVIRDAEMAGLCALISPRPMLVINGERDPQFTVAGARRVLEKVKPLYDLVDALRLRLHVVDADHGYDQAMREAAYGWFLYWLADSGDASPVSEAPATLLPVDAPELRCFDGAPPSADDAFRRVVEEAANRHGAKSGRSARKAVSQVALRGLLGLDAAPEEAGSPSLRAAPSRGARLVIASEPGIELPVSKLGDWSGSARIRLVIADERIDEFELGAWLDAHQEIDGVLSISPRGMGPTAPEPPEEMTLATVDGTLEKFTPQPGEHLQFETATNSLMLGRSLLGQQVGDVLAALTAVRADNPDATVELEGRGVLPSVQAVMAAALDEGVSRVEVDTLLHSMMELVSDPDASLPLPLYVYDALRVADIQDIVILLASRTLIVGALADSRGRPYRRDAAIAMYADAAGAFEQQGGSLRIG